MDAELQEIADDLKEAESLLMELLADRDGNEPPAEKKVWLVYLLVEKSVALLKLYLSIERPGLFLTVKSNPDDWAGLLERAGVALGDGRRLLELGKLEESLETLRTSRNCLRAFLRDRRRVRLRSARAAKRSAG